MEGEDIHLVEVDRRLPVVVSQEVEVPHADLTEVTGVELIEVGAVVVLNASKSIPSAFMSFQHVPDKVS